MAKKTGANTESEKVVLPTILQITAKASGVRQKFGLDSLAAHFEKNGDGDITIIGNGAGNPDIILTFIEAKHHLEIMSRRGKIGGTPISRIGKSIGKCCESIPGIKISLLSF